MHACRHATRRGMVTDGACECCGVQVAGVVAHVGMSATAMAKLSKSKGGDHDLNAAVQVHAFHGLDGARLLALG